MHQSTTKKYKSHTNRLRTLHLRKGASLALVVALLAQILLPMAAFADGDFGWVVPLGSGATANGTGVAVDGSGNVISTGEFFGTGTFGSPTTMMSTDTDVYISRLSADGEFDASARQIKIGGSGDDSGQDVAVDANGNMIVTGWFRETVDFNPGAPVASITSNGNDDIFVLKLDNNGDYLWSQGYGALEADHGYGITTDSNGDVYVVGDFRSSVAFGGTTLNSSGNTDGFLLKLGGADGTPAWVKQTAGPSGDRSTAVVANASAVYSVGYFQGTTNFGGESIQTKGRNDGFITAHDLNGVYQWTKRIGSKEADAVYGVDVDAAGDIYVTGFFSGTAEFIGSTEATTTGNRDVFVSKLNSSGSLQWVQTFGGVADDEGYGIKVGSDGRIYVTGYFEGTTTLPDASTLVAEGGENSFMAVFGTDGTFQFARQLGRGADGRAADIALDANNNPVITGDFTGTGDFDPSSAASENVTSQNGTDGYVVKLLSSDTPLNNAPTASDDMFSVNQGATNELLDVLVNDSDIEDITVTLTDVDATTSAGGSASLSGSMISYSTPDLNFTGIDVFSYTIMDTGGLTDTATVTVTVEMTGTSNTAPTAQSQPVSVAKNQSRSITLTGADVDGDVLAFSIATAPTNGAVSTPVATSDTSATVMYTPTVDFTGSDSFTFQVDDGNTGTATATVNITVVEEAGAAPDATDVTVGVDEDSSVEITFSATDSDTNDTLSYQLVTQPANGSVSDVMTDTVVYTPTADFNGADSFTYMVMDSFGLTDTAVVNITINPVNDAPTAPSEPQQVGVGENMSQSISLTGEDLDGDTLSFSIVTQPSNGTLSDITSTGAASASVDYTPSAGFVGTDSFTYEVSDGTATAQATVNITVNDTNDAPVASDATAETPEDEAVTITLSASDADGDALTFSVLSLPSSGDLSGITSVDDSSATITYTPAGPGTFEFDYEVDDSNGGTDTGTVTITVTEVTGGGGDDDVEVFLPITPRS